MSDIITIHLPLPPRNGRAQTLLPHCRVLIEEGADPDAVVHVMRGDTLCFVPTTLHVFAGLAVKENDTTSARFVPYRALPDDAHATRP